MSKALPTDLQIQDSTLPSHVTGASARAEPSSQLPIRNRQRYKFIEEFARGGLGRIWRVKDTELGREVAFKESLDQSRESEIRFTREALSTAQLEHPNIIPVHDAGRTDSGELFYTMKLVRGQTLEEVVAKSKNFAERTSLLPRVLAVSEAIAYAHNHKVLHRDLKPSNILVGDYGETSVIDWGLAKTLNGVEEQEGQKEPSFVAESHLTRVGAVMGTPAYMSKEQASGAPANELTDIYALGACLYFVVTGRAPYKGAGSNDVIAQVITTSPTRVAQLAVEAPKDLVAIIEKAMERTIENRYPTAREFADDLNRFLTGQRVLAHTYTAYERSAKWVQKNRRWAVATVVAFLFFLVAATFAAIRQRSLTKDAEAQRGFAQKSTQTLLEQQGRLELASGHPQKAAVYFSQALQFAPDDLPLRYLVSQSIRPVAAQVHQLIGHTQDVVSVAYSPNGNWLTTGGDDGAIRLWNAKTGEAVRKLTQHTKGIDAVAFSADSEWVVSGSLDNKIRVMKIDGSVTKTIDEPISYRVAVTPDGTRIVSGGQNGTLVIRDIETGRLLHTLKQHTDRTQHLSFTKRNELVVASWDRTLSIWNIDTGQQLRLLKGFDSDVVWVAFSKDGKFAAIVESDVYIHIYKLPTWERSHSIRMSENARFASVWFTNNDSTLIASAHDGVVRAFHAASGQLLAVVDVMPVGKLFSSALSPDANALATAGIHGTVGIWSLKNVFDFRVIPFPADTRETVLPSEYLRNDIFLATTNGHFSQWSADTLEKKFEFEVGIAPETLGLSQQAGTVLVTNYREKNKATPLFSLGTGEKIGAVEHPRLAHNIAVSADGQTYATACYDGNVRLADAKTGALKNMFFIDKERLSTVAFSKSGLELAVSNGVGQLFFVDAKTGQIKSSFKAHATWIQDIEYSEDDTRIVTAGRQDHQVKVWDAKSHSLLQTLTEHTNNVMRAHFSHNGKLLATVGVDHRAHLFDVSSGRLLRTFVGADFSAQFSSDDSELLTTGVNGYAVLWKIQPDARSTKELLSFVEKNSPWQIVNGALKLKTE